jgi:hypothetical protein
MDSHYNDNENRREVIFSYENGDVYMGEMVNGLRNGRGTLRTPAFVNKIDCTKLEYEYTREYAVENAHLAKWHEYIGEWVNDKMHGCGVHLWKSGNGAEVTMFHGEWINGQPQRNRRPSESESDPEPESTTSMLMTMNEELELEVFGY